MTYELRRLILLSLLFTINLEHVLSKPMSSSDCTIENNRLPKTIIKMYNFTELSNSDVTVSLGKAKETIRLRLCSPLLKKCGDRDGYGICLTKDGKEIGIGRSPLILNNLNDTLLFNTTGDLCERDKNYTVFITMKCDYSVTGHSGPTIFPDHPDSCRIDMLWRTKFACIPATTINCSISDQFNNTFDLSPLSRYSDNHVIHLDEKYSTRMIINICHSVIYEYGTTCPRRVGACLVNSSAAGIEYASYGELHEDSLVIEDNILKIRYKAGDLCTNNMNLDQHQTTISFICDPAATVDTRPKYSNESKPCAYEFIWKTAAACKKTFLNQRIETTGCTVADPDTKFQYNLQTLMNRDIIANTTDNTSYKLRICGSVLDTGCPEGTGVCDIQKKASAGASNSNLIWRHGGPYLNYTDGVSCGNGQRRYTLISFECGVKDSESLPIILRDEPCYLIIHWNTKLVCARGIRRTTCALNQTNLVPLIRSSKDYVVKALGKEFHINICRPMIPTPGLACPHGSVVCQAVTNTQGQYTNETSLGFLYDKPALDGDQNLILNYHRGSPCPENSDKNISSSFKFICDYGGDAGFPGYKNYSDCRYTFEWETNVVCGAVVGKWFSRCTVMDPSHLYRVDLSLLYERPSPRFVSIKGKNYSINICGGKEHCNGSAVCQGTNGYGTFSHVIFDYGSKMIKLQYLNGTKCSNQSYESELALICNSTVGIGHPVLKLDANCSALFEWQTIVACPGGMHEVIFSDPLITTEKILVDTWETYSPVQAWIIAIMLILVMLVVGVWLYLREPRRCAHVRSRIGAIRTAAKYNDRAQYSKEDAWQQ